MVPQSRASSSTDIKEKEAGVGRKGDGRDSKLGYRKKGGKWRPEGGENQCWEGWG